MIEIPPCDILLFTATQSEEEALGDAARSLQIAVQTHEGPLGTFHFLGQVGSNRVLVVRTGMGALDHRGSAARAIHYLYKTQATGIISVGMAFGCDPRSQRPSDILIGTQLVPYDNRDIKLVDGAVTTTYERVKRRRAKTSLVSLMRRHSDRYEAGVHFDALLSGAARIQTALFRDQLRSALSRGGETIIGGEMEGVGLLAALASRERMSNIRQLVEPKRERTLHGRVESWVQQARCHGGISLSRSLERAPNLFDQRGATVR